MGVIIIQQPHNGNFHLGESPDSLQHNTWIYKQDEESKFKCESYY